MHAKQAPKHGKLTWNWDADIIIIMNIIGTFSNIYENRWIVCSSRTKSSSDVTAWQFSQRCLIHHHQEQQCFHLEIKFSRSSLRTIAVMLKQAISKKEHKHKRHFISKASRPDWLYLSVVCGLSLLRVHTNRFNSKMIKSCYLAPHRLNFYLSCAKS